MPYQDQPVRYNICMKLSEGKLKRMNALSNERGVIAAAAWISGEACRSRAVGRGVDVKEITPE